MILLLQDEKELKVDKCTNSMKESSLEKDEIKGNDCEKKNLTEVRAMHDYSSGIMKAFSILVTVATILGVLLMLSRDMEKIGNGMQDPEFFNVIHKTTENSILNDITTPLDNLCDGLYLLLSNFFKSIAF